jgi:nuclear cap-binding protein subunit 1
VKQIRSLVPPIIPAISEGFRIGVTEQPYKIPYYAALLRLLYEQDEHSASEGPSLGKQILEDYWKGFQAFLDKLAWRETRLCIQFFAHLTVAGVISSESMFSLLQSFTTVLDEFGVSHGRAKKAALCAAEGLMIGGPILKPHSASAVTDIINAIQTYNESSAAAKWLVQPSVSTEIAAELLDISLAVLKVSDSSDFAETVYSYQQPYSHFPSLDPAVSVTFSLPSVLVPPEIIELDGLSTDSGEDAQVKKEEWPEFFPHLFPNDVRQSFISHLASVSN